jgi:acyl dehydratase
MPFGLMLFLTTSMTHADAAKVQVGFGNVIYHWPAFSGDTFTKSFEVNTIRNTSDGNHTVIHFTCQLFNQRGRICMTADKRMLFEFSVPEGEELSTSTSTSLSSSHDDPLRNDDSITNQSFRDHLLSKAETISDAGSQSLSILTTGQLIFHQMNRSLTLSQSQQLATLARLTHPRHFDTRRFDTKTEIMIPGGLVLGMAMSSSSRDLHEILHEELLSCSYVNSLHPGDVVSGMSYVKSVNDASPWDLESLTVRTIAVKNVDLIRDLDSRRGLPIELFTSDHMMSTREIERICKEKCPNLCHKIVVICDRKILRQSPKRVQTFLL